MKETNNTTTPYPYSIYQDPSYFRGPAYEYIRGSDQIPLVGSLVPDEDWPFKVRLFLPGTDFNFFVCAIDDGINAPMSQGLKDVCLNGVTRTASGLSPLTFAAPKLLGMRNYNGLPLQRDLLFKPMSILELARFATVANSIGSLKGAR
jgi:hypothetical protein